MFKTYMRLLGFARPIKKYAIPYFFYSLFYALFNSLTFMLIIPILNTMFDANYSFEYVEKLPPLELNQDYLATLFNFAYSHIFEQYDRQNVLMLLAIVAICISLMSNLFRYLGAWTMENMRTRTLQRMRNEMFSRVMDMNVGYFSDQRKGDIISKITSDVGVVQFCITNTLQVSFREPFLIIGYIGDDGGHFVGAGHLLGAVPPGGGPADRQHREETPPPGPHQPAAHGRDGLDARRVALGHQGHQEL